MADKIKRDDINWCSLNKSSILVLMRISLLNKWQAFFESSVCRFYYWSRYLTTIKRVWHRFRLTKRNDTLLTSFEASVIFEAFYRSLNQTTIIKFGLSKSATRKWDSNDNNIIFNNEFFIFSSFRIYNSPSILAVIRMWPSSTSRRCSRPATRHTFKRNTEGSYSAL